MSKILGNVQDVWREGYIWIIKKRVVGQEVGMKGGKQRGGDRWFE